MALDWKKITAKAAKRTDEILASEISSLTRMTDNEIDDLFPEPIDKENLAELMEIVKSADSENQKVDRIIGNIDKFARVVLKLADKVV